MQESRAQRGRAIADRIAAESGRSVQFRVERQYLPQQWIVRVAGPHARDVAARREYRKLAGRFSRAECIFRRQLQYTTQLEWVSECILERASPRLLRAFKPAGLRIAICGKLRYLYNHIQRRFTSYGPGKVSANCPVLSLTQPRDGLHGWGELSLP